MLTEIAKRRNEEEEADRKIGDRNIKGKEVLRGWEVRDVDSV